VLVIRGDRGGVGVSWGKLRRWRGLTLRSSKGRCYSLVGIAFRSSCYAIRQSKLFNAAGMHPTLGVTFRPSCNEPFLELHHPKCCSACIEKAKSNKLTRTAESSPHCRDPAPHLPYPSLVVCQYHCAHSQLS
jgi:hypothetical protein